MTPSSHRLRLEPSNSLCPGLKSPSFLHQSLDPSQPPSFVTWRSRVSSVPAWRRCAPSGSAWIAELPPSQSGADQLQPSQPRTADFPPSQPGDTELRLSQPGATEAPCSLGLRLEPPSSLRLSLKSAPDHLGLRHASQPRVAELPLFRLGVDEVISPQSKTTQLPPSQPRAFELIAAYSSRAPSVPA